ncbi:hypothetical protein [Vibrio jasicida]|uniref:hypothetical protein n=2 Tax=Vibrio jasicida TaxID=766224 RepID=UPI000586FB47|nr:hypothetical protein [Vibrio jasicida]
MNIKHIIKIALSIVSLPFFNATGGDFTLYIPSSKEHLETHIQFSHAIYNSIQFMSDDIVRQSWGLYAVINNTVFMVSVNKEYKFLDGKRKVNINQDIEFHDHLSQINIAEIDKEKNTIYLTKRFDNEKINNAEITGKLGFW